MFGFGRKKTQPTFKQRVASFWKWYAANADHFFQAIKGGRCEDLNPEISEFMDMTLPHLSWVFGPGENGGHSFTLTGEGDRLRQLLTNYWLQQAPSIPGWTFYASRQPSPAESLKTIAIRLGDNAQVDCQSLLIKTEVDADKQLIHIVAWHANFAELPEEHHAQMLLLLLDETLGEFGVEKWIGRIEIEPVVPGEFVRPLASLPDFIEKMNAYHQWEKLEPLDTYSSYQLDEQSDHRRGDVFVGTTCIPDVIGELMEHQGRLNTDPLAGLGAELAYLAFDSAAFPEGAEVEARGEIEDALDEALQTQASGRVLGGAFGTEHAYVDLLLFDGEDSRRIVEATLKRFELRGQRSFETFC